jgi:peptide/nickel transport system permease protein
MRMIPGNISDVILADAGGTAQERAEQKLVIERELGIAEPGVTQYVKWVGGVLRGDFGRSLWDGTSVSSDVARRARVSGWLAAWIAITASAFAVPLGIVAATCRSRRAVDQSILFMSTIGISIPTFVSATLVIYGLVTAFGWTPSLHYAHFWESPFTNLSIIVAPVLIESYSIGSPIMRMVRSSLRDTMGQDYTRTATAKGLHPRTVIIRHAVRNAMTPIIGYMGWSLSRLIGGLVILETMFNMPGLGKGLIDAVNHRDYATIQGFVLVIGVGYVMFNLLVDLAIAWADPRVRLAERHA